MYYGTPNAHLNQYHHTFSNYGHPSRQLYEIPHNLRVSPQVFDERSNYITSATQNGYQQIKKTKSQLPIYPNENTKNGNESQLKHSKYWAARINQVPEQDFSVQSIQEVPECSQKTNHDKQFNQQIPQGRSFHKSGQLNEFQKYSQNCQKHSLFSPYTQSYLQIEQEQVFCIICNQSFFSHQQKEHLLIHRNKNKTQFTATRQQQQKLEASLKQVNLSFGPIKKLISAPEQFIVPYDINIQTKRLTKPQLNQRVKRVQTSTQSEFSREIPQAGKYVCYKAEQQRESPRSLQKNQIEIDKKSRVSLLQSEDSFVVLDREQYFIGKTQFQIMNFGSKMKIQSDDPREAPEFQQSQQPKNEPSNQSETNKLIGFSQLDTDKLGGQVPVKLEAPRVCKQLQKIRKPTASQQSVCSLNFDQSQPDQHELRVDQSRDSFSLHSLRTENNCTNFGEQCFIGAVQKQKCLPSYPRPHDFKKYSQRKLSNRQKQFEDPPSALNQQSKQQISSNKTIVSNKYFGLGMQSKDLSEANSKRHGLNETVQNKNLLSKQASSIKQSSSSKRQKTARNILAQNHEQLVQDLIEIRSAK